MVLRGAAADLVRRQRGDRDAGVEIHPRRLGAGHDHGLELQRVPPEGEVGGGRGVGRNRDAGRLGLEPQQPRAERVTAGGNPAQGVTPIRPALSAEGGSVDVNLRIRDARSRLIHHPPGNAAGSCGLLG